MLNKKKLGLKETSSGSGIFTCTGEPEDFWKGLTKASRKKIKEAE